MEVKWINDSSQMLEELEREVLEIELDDAKWRDFVNDPSTYLENAGLVDPVWMVDDKQKRFSEVVASADEAVRLPVARALLRKVAPSEIKMEDGDNEPQPYGVPNAVPFFNFVYLANFMIYYNVNWEENFWGYEPNVVHGAVRMAPINLSDTYLEGGVCTELDKRGYSLARQAAVIKAVVAKRLGEKLEDGKYSVDLNHDDLQFKLEFAVDQDGIVVSDAQVIENVV